MTDSNKEIKKVTIFSLIPTFSCSLLKSSSFPQPNLIIKPNTAVVLSNARQSASVPCDLAGGNPSKCLCRFINEKDFGILGMEKLSFFLDLNFSDQYICFNLMGCTFLERVLLVPVGVCSTFEELSIS